MDGLMLAARIEHRACVNFLDLLGCFVFNNAIVCEKRIQVGKV